MCWTHYYCKNKIVFTDCLKVSADHSGSQRSQRSSCSEFRTVGLATENCVDIVLALPAAAAAAADGDDDSENIDVADAVTGTSGDDISDGEAGGSVSGGE